MQRPKRARPPTELAPGTVAVDAKRASPSGWMPRVGPRKLVLLVDDDEEGRRICADVLEAVGFRVAQAADGAMGLAEAFADPPDVILMDVEMPVMGGIDAIRRLKADDRTRAIPIVVLTSSGLFNVETATRLGVSAYLLKPCSWEELEGVVTSLAPLEAVSPGRS